MTYKSITFFGLFLLLASCIPLKIAPNYKHGKVVKGKKFVKVFKSQQVFAFNDPKEANEFYTYINEKYQLVYDDDTGNVPVQIAQNTMYLTFYEVEKATKTYNLLPVLADKALETANIGPVLENQYSSRKGHWYIVMTLTDSEYQDVLQEDHPHHESAVSYLQSLRQEYLITAQYNELQFLEQ